MHDRDDGNLLVCGSGEGGKSNTNGKLFGRTIHVSRYWTTLKKNKRFSVVFRPGHVRVVVSRRLPPSLLINAFLSHHKANPPLP